MATTDLYLNTADLDFQIGETGDLVTTTNVVTQDAWKDVMMNNANFIFDDLLGSYLYQIPQYGNTAASRALAVGYIRLALEPEVAAGRLQILSIDVSKVTEYGAIFTVQFRDLTTGLEGTITSL